MSGDVLDRKQAFPGYKNMNSILLPADVFKGTGFSPRFLSKILNFLFLVFVRKKCSENISLDVLDVNITSLSKTMKISILPSHQIGCFLRG